MDLDAMAEVGDQIANGGRAVPATVVVFDAFIKGEPFPAMRPRADYDHRRMYTPVKYRDALKLLEEELAWRKKVKEPVVVPVLVAVTFYRATRIGVDVDNLTKTVLDAGSGILWHDDRLVYELRVRKVVGMGKRCGTKLHVRTI